MIKEAQVNNTHTQQELSILYVCQDFDEARLGSGSSLLDSSFGSRSRIGECTKQARGVNFRQGGAIL